MPVIDAHPHLKQVRQVSLIYPSCDDVTLGRNRVRGNTSPTRVKYGLPGKIHTPSRQGKQFSTRKK